MRCEDYPCCSHGPPPLGDGGGCPDSQGRFNCVDCGRKLPKGNSSSLCNNCITRMRSDDWESERDYYDDGRDEY